MKLFIIVLVATVFIGIPIGILFTIWFLEMHEKKEILEELGEAIEGKTAMIDERTLLQ